MPGRRLRPTEIREAAQIFGDDLAYGSIRVHEGVRWLNWIAAATSWMMRRPAPPWGTAVTLGAHLFFPYPLRTEAEALEAGLYGDTAWLMHELTQVRQFQQVGIRHVLRSLWRQLRGDGAGDDYGAEAGLTAAGRRNASLADFRPEQQATIVRDYYLRKKQGAPTTAWDPFIAELRGN